MDIKEASAMTEASGLVDDRTGLENSSGRMPGGGRATDPRPSAARISEQLRKMTLDAPLRSLSLAFLLGFWVARRR